MQEKTYTDYLQLATHFLETHFDLSPTIEDIKKKLLELAPQYRPAYWRRLRRGLSLFLAKQSKRDAQSISILRNPTTALDNLDLKKPKQRRVKKVTESDHNKLTGYLKEVRDLPCLAAVMIVRLTGCRPAELNSIQLLGQNKIYVAGVKKISDIRGRDRVLHLSQKSYAIITLLLPHIHHDEQGITSDISRIQRRLQRHVKKLWPSRKAHISLYSYRHQLGANLKASCMSSTEISAIMGHQSENSISVYGDVRSRSFVEPPRLAADERYLEKHRNGINKSNH